jgi:hypothetical protein
MAEISSKQLGDKLAVWKRRVLEYEAVVELVQALRDMGISVHAVCPRCGSLGSIGILKSSGYTYLVIRHPDRSTHAVPRHRIFELSPELCRVKKELEYILQIFRKHEEGVKFCADEKPAATSMT